MDKEFEDWLKKDDLFQYYLDNPSSREHIFIDYQLELFYKNKDEFMEWFFRNTELAEVKFPYIFKMLSNLVKDSPSILTANLIQDLPKKFPKWESEVKNFTGITKRKYIEEILELLHFALNINYRSEIEQHALKSVTEELLEQKVRWEKKLSDIKKVGTTILPDPVEVAESYYTEKNSRNRAYKTEDIVPIMKETKEYLKKNPDLKSIQGHIKTIIDMCIRFEGGKEAKSNWIKCYAEKAGLKIK